MCENSMQPQDMTTEEVSCLDAQTKISDAAVARDLDNVTIEYDSSSETLEKTENHACGFCNCGVEL